MKHDATITIVVRKLDSLKPHPLQNVLFPSLSNVELQSLADDLKKNAQTSGGDYARRHDHLWPSARRRREAARLDGDQVRHPPRPRRRLG